MITENRKGILFIFFSTLIFVTMNNTLPLMGGPYIVGDLGGSNQISFYVITFFSVGNAVGVPLGRGALGRLRPDRFFLLVLTLFACLSTLIALVNHYPIFLIVRFFQGVISGTVFPVISTLFSYLSPPKDKNKISYTIMTIFTVVPATAAAFGGWISYDYHWRWLFYMNTPLFLFCSFYLWNRLKNISFPLKKEPFDTIGYVLYVLGVTSLCGVITLGQELDWFRSSLIIVLAIVGVLSTIFFVSWELEHPHPILNLRLLKNFVFSFALLNLGLLFSAYFGMVILLALWLTLWVNYTPLWIGLIIGTMAIAGFLPRLLFLEGYEKMDARIPLLLAIILLAYSSFHTMYFNIEIDFERIAFSRVIAGFGLAFFLTPLFRLSFHTFATEQTLAVTTFFQFTRVLGSGLGAAFYSTLWLRRQAFFHDRLGSQLTVFSPETQQYYAKAAQAGLEGEVATGELSFFLDQQSTALALDDCFYFMAWLLVSLFILTAFTFFLPKRLFFPEKN